MDRNYFEQKLQKAKEIYQSRPTLYSPYFQSEITLNSEGFHHLRYSLGKERSKEEQVLKFTLLPLALHILARATTLQEYRKNELTEWWGFFAIFAAYEIKVRAIVKKVCNGKIIFWSVMPYARLKQGHPQRLFEEGIDFG